MKKNWKGKNERKQRRERDVAITDKVVSEGTSEKVTFEQRPERGWGMTHEDSGETVRTGSAPGRRNITAKFLRQRSLGIIERNVKTSMAGEGCMGGGQGMQGRGVGNKITV